MAAQVEQQPIGMVGMVRLEQMPMAADIMAQTVLPRVVEQLVLQ